MTPRKPVPFQRRRSHLAGKVALFLTIFGFCLGVNLVLVYGATLGDISRPPAPDPIEATTPPSPPPGRHLEP